MAEKKVPELRVIPKDEAFEKMVRACAGNDAGREFMAWLARRCGQFQSSLTRKADGEVAELATEAKEAQRLIWVEVRDALSIEGRHGIESLAEMQIEEALKRKIEAAQPKK